MRAARPRFMRDDKTAGRDTLICWAALVIGSWTVTAGVAFAVCALAGCFHH